MSRYTLSLTLLAVATTVLGQSIPLAQKRFDYPAGIPYQADTDEGVRGRQSGYNQCNSTTEGQASLCQTAFVNHLDDFCLWGPQLPNSIIGDTEGETVAWCTKPGHGTRLIPAGALTGVQFMRTPDYIQVVGFINQVLLNIEANDFGGEMDPHGADLRGNPLGGLVYSNAFPSNNGNNATYQQVIEWHNFMGGGAFCFKACDPAGPNAARFCEHVFDRIGCAYNAPNSAHNGVFESCQGENQDFPGIYVENGVTVTYQQPPESLGAISTIPYTARVPASSNCVQFQSAALFTGAPTPTILTTPTPTATGGAATAKPSAGGSTSRTSGSAAPTSTSGARSLAVSSLTSLLAVAFAVVIFA